MKHLPTTNRPPATLALVKSEAVKAHLSAPTIRQIHPDELTDPLNALILTIAQKQGLKVDAIQVQDVSRFICRHFKDFTLEEVSLAFEYYNARKLNTPQGFGAYGLLSQEFFGTVLKAFRDYRTEEMRKENVKIHKIKELTPEELRKKNTEAIRKGVLEAWEYFKENEKIQNEPTADLMGSFYYDYLRASGFMVKPDEDTTEAIKKEAINVYEQSLTDRKASASSPLEAKKILNQIKTITPKDRADKIRLLCKKIGLRLYFEECLFNDVDLTEKLNT